jgi:hypothetical protein
MTDRSYESPAALERAVTDRLAAKYPKDEFQSRRNEVAYRRLLARMYGADPERWVVKGGFALILRLDPSRPSNDIDVTYVDAAAEHAVALEALERAAGYELDDFFSFEVDRVGEETEDRARRITVIARLGAKEFSRFRVDLALPSPAVPTERIDAPPLVGIDEIDALPSILVLAWPQQIADKVCAVFERYGDGFSSRVRDLADLAMIAQQVDGLSANALIDAVLAEAAKRRARLLVDGLPGSFTLPAEQAGEWRATWAKSSRNALFSFDEALILAKAFLDPVLDGSAAGQTWSRARAEYDYP